MIRRTHIKAKRSKPRRGPLRSVPYRSWLRKELCAIEKKFETGAMCWYVNAISDAAHTENNGMGSKGSDSSCGPLCRGHHREYDAGRKAFEKKYGVDMKAIAAEHWQRYQQEKAA